MAHALLSGSTRLTISRPVAVGRRQPVVQRCAYRAANRRPVVVKALFNFLTPKPEAKTKDPRADELAEQLIDLCSRAKGGANIREDVEELVSDLAQYSTPNPLKSPLLWGTWDVLYCTKPTAVGGPLKKGPGPVVFTGQAASQVLEQPDRLTNIVVFKTLGFLKGFSKQYGRIKPLSGDTFLLSIDSGELNAGVGMQTRDFDIQRKIQIVYLDENLRVARFLPSSELSDSEQEEAGGEQEEILFVFQRAVEEAEEEEEAAAEGEEPEKTSSGSKITLAIPGFGGTRKVEGLATRAERQVREQMTEKGGGGLFGTRRSRTPVQVEEEEEEDNPQERRRREREEAAARRAAEAEARRAAEEEKRRAVEAKKQAEEEQRRRKAEEAAQAAQEARERAEAEKAARAERQVAIRELLSELSEEAKEKQSAAKEALAALREVQKENGPLLKSTSKAEAEVEEAEEEVAKVSAALDEALEVRKAAEQELKAAQQRLKDAEAEFKRKRDAAFSRR